MATANLDLVIGLVDRASGPLGRITGALSTLGTLAGGAALAGVGALGAALATGIGDAREAAKVYAQTEAVIASTGGAAGLSAEQIADMAGSLSAASGQSLFGDDDIQSAQNMLLTFTKIGKDVFPQATQAMVDMATAMGTDVQGGAIQLGKALNDPIAGVSALGRAGVQFSDDQKAMIASLVETGDLAGAQAVILKELETQFGGSAAAAAAADGGFAQFKDRLGELAESVGAQVLPALSSLLGWLNSPEIQTATQAIVGGLVTGFTTLVTSIQGVVAALQGFDWAAWAPVIAGIGAAVLTVLVPGMIAWATATYAQVAANVALAAATLAAYAPIIAIAAAVGVAIAALYLAWQSNFLGIRDITAQVWGWLSGTVWPWIVSAFNNVAAVVLPILSAAFTVAWTAIQTAVTTVYTWLSGTVWPWLVSALTNVASVLIPALQLAWQVAWPAIQTAVNAVYTFLSGTVWPWLETSFSWLSDTALPAAQTAFEVGWSAMKTAVNTAYVTWSTVVWPWLKTNLGNIVSWIETARSGWDTAWTAIGSAVTAARDVISGAIDTIKRLIDNAIAGINTLIDLANRLPGIEIPSVPSGGGGGSSGFGGGTPATVGGRSVEASGSGTYVARQVVLNVQRPMNVDSEFAGLDAWANAGRS